MHENAQSNGANQRDHIDGGVDLPAAAGGIRRHEAKERDGDETVELEIPHRPAEAELPHQEHDEDEQGRYERRGVADEEGLKARVVGTALEDGLAGFVAVLVVVPEAARRAEAGDVSDAHRERSQQHEHLAEPQHCALLRPLFLRFAGLLLQLRRLVLPLARREVNQEVGDDAGEQEEGVYGGENVAESAGGVGDYKTEQVQDHDEPEDGEPLGRG